MLWFGLKLWCDCEPNLLHCYCWYWLLMH